MNQWLDAIRGIGTSYFESRRPVADSVTPPAVTNAMPWLVPAAIIGGGVLLLVVVISMFRGK